MTPKAHMKSPVKLLTLFLLILAGCETPQPDFHDLSATTAEGRPWLQPIAQENQTITTKENRIYIQKAGNDSTGVDLECGIYLDDHGTCIVYKIVNGNSFRSIIAFPKISLKDAKGNEMKLSPLTPTQQIGFTAVGVGASGEGQGRYWKIPAASGVMGNEAFVGLPSAYPVTVSWQYMEGKVGTFMFDAPKQ